MYSIILLFGACFVAELCTGQSITPTPTGTLVSRSTLDVPVDTTVLASCDYCFLAPGCTDTSSANKEYLLFTAYSMTSAFAQDGSCFTVSGASTPLQTPYSVAKPATATAQPAEYSSAVASLFVDHLNVPDWGICGENGSLAVHLADAKTTQFVDVAVPTVLGAVSRTPLLTPSSTATSVISHSSLSAPTSTGLSTSAKAAIGIAVPVIVLAVVLSGLILWFTYRKRRVARMERRTEDKLGTEMESEI